MIPYNFHELPITEQLLIIAHELAVQTGTYTEPKPIDASEINPEDVPF